MAYIGLILCRYCLKSPLDMSSKMIISCNEETTSMNNYNVRKCNTQMIASVPGYNYQRFND